MGAGYVVGTGQIATPTRESFLCAILPTKGMVLHGDGCWEEAKWDAYPARHATQLWRLAEGAAVNSTAAIIGLLGGASLRLLLV